MVQTVPPPSFCCFECKCRLGTRQHFRKITCIIVPWTACCAWFAVVDAPLSRIPMLCVTLWVTVTDVEPSNRRDSEQAHACASFRVDKLKSLYHHRSWMTMCYASPECIPRFQKTLTPLHSLQGMQYAIRMSISRDLPMRYCIILLI